MIELVTLLGNKTLGQEDDFWDWKGTKSRKFSVKSMYDVLLKKNDDFPSLPPSFSYRSVWAPNVPTNVKFFLWSFAWERVLTLDNLISRGFIMPNMCALCKGDAESISYLFFSCPKTRLVSNSLVFHLPNAQMLCSFDGFSNLSLDWPSFNSKGLAAQIWEILPFAVLWTVWCARNNAIFRDEAFEVQAVVRTVKCRCWSWLDITKRGTQEKQHHKVTDLLGGWDTLIQDRGQTEATR